MTLRSLLISGLLLVVTRAALAAPCTSDDFETHVTGVHECIVIRHYGNSASTTPDAMVVFIHGDVSSGGPANYHFRLAEKEASTKIATIALVRPGYPDGAGNASSGDSNGRADNYTRENIAEVGTAIEHLRDHFKPGRVILVGHSGGSATAAVLLGSMPKLAAGAVLVSCPCDIVRWRTGRRPWPQSESPIAWADKVDPATRVIALTGTQDENTSAELAQAYVATLKARGIDASFIAVPNANHNHAFDSTLVTEAIASLVAH